jgi:hypothetical protein
MTHKLLSYRTFAALAILSLFCASVGAQSPKGGVGNTTPFPRTADGHPDLTGMWNGTAADRNLGGGAPDEIRVSLEARDGKFVNFERDDTIVRRMDQNRPLYKPQYWETVHDLDLEGNDADPQFRGMPNGVPRMGPPIKIIQLPTEMVFFYQNPDTYRVIPTDGRPHTPDEKLEGTWKGESLGHWEGDSFVVDTVGFNSSSWLCIEGCIHSENMHVIERLTRKGGTIAYDVTVDDPDMFLKPWVMNPRTVVLNADPKAVPDESLPYQERDVSHFVTKEHH